MIVDPTTGLPAKRRTEAPFPPELFDRLATLSDTLTMQGIVLTCARCGSPIQGCNHPNDPTFYLDCECARRTFERNAARQRVQLHGDVTPTVGRA